MMNQRATQSGKMMLIVDDEEPVVRALSLRCKHLGLEVQTAGNAVEAMSVINAEHEPPDLLLLDLDLPGADGLTLCDMIKTNADFSQVPVILLTGSDNDETKRRCLKAGAHFVRKDTNSWEVLEPLICRLLKIEGQPTGSVSTAHKAKVSAPSPPRSAQPKIQRKKILIVDDDPTVTKGLRVRFEALGYDSIDAAGGREGFWLALEEKPDLIVLDYKMPDGYGNTVLGKLKSSPVTRGIPVIILSGMTDRGVQRDVLRLGAQCWINKPFDFNELMQVIRDTFD